MTVTISFKTASGLLINLCHEMIRDNQTIKQPAYYGTNFLLSFHGKNHSEKGSTMGTAVILPPKPK